MRPRGQRPRASRLVLLALSVLTVIATTEVPAYAGGSSAPSTSPAITSTPTSPTTADQLTWGFTSTAAATSCELDRGATVISALADCTSGDPSASFDVSSDPGGSYTFTVYDAAAADVVAGTASDTSTLDVAPVAPVVTRTTASPGTSTSPAWTFDTPTGATVACELDDGDGHALDSQDPCTSPYDGNLAGHDDGQYTLSVTATAGGVTGAAATSSYRLDTTAPDAPTLTPPAATGHDRTPSFAVSGLEPDATTTCTATGPDADAVPITGCDAGTPTLHIPPGAADGDYTLATTQTDAAGNTGAAADAIYSLDTTAPAAPAVTAPTSPGTDRTPSFTVTDTEPGASFQCSVSGPSPATVSACGPTSTVDLSGADNGDYVLSVTATDAAGNISDAATSDYRLDAAQPPAPMVVGPTTGRDRTPSFAVTDGQDDVSFSCTVDGPSTAQVTACGPTTALDLTGDVDGDYTVTVTATDPLGQASIAGTATYTLDTTPPPLPVVTPPGSPDSDLAPTFGVTDSETGSTFFCTVSSPSTVTITDCGAATTLDLSQAADGVYTVSVTATDAAGNTSDPASASYTLDTTPPPAPDVVVPTSPSNATSPVFGISDTDATSRLNCVLLNPIAAIIASGRCPVTGRFDTSGSPDGTYDLVVTAADHAGNTASTSVTWRRDTTPPPAPDVTAPVSPSRDDVAGFTITEADPSATLSCLMTASDGSVVVTGACPPVGSVDTTGFVDGTFSLSVTATDDVGNGATTTVTWTRDTAAPPTPTVTAPASPSKDTTPTFVLADTEPGVTLDCVLLGPDGTMVGSAVSCPADGKVPTGGAGDGSYTLQVTAVDEVGNVSPMASATYTLDTTAPPAPDVTAPVSPSHNRAPVFTVSDTEPGVTYACTVTGGSPVAVTGCGTSTTVDLSAATDDTYTLAVTATDSAGNTSDAGTASYQLDSIAPPAPTLSAPASPSQNTAPIFALNDTATGVTFDCTVSPTVAVSDCDSAPQLDLSAAADGSYTLSVTATDVAGNTSSAAVASYTLDTTAPPAPTVVAPTSPSSDTTPDFWITDTESGVTLDCVFTSPGGTALATGPCPTGGHFDTTAGGDGTYTLAVTATDTAGNATSTTVTWTLDTTAPPVPVVVAPASPGNTTTPIFTVSDGDATATLTCLFTSPGGRTVATGTCPPDGGFSTAAFGDGVYTLVVTATDPAGNVSSTTVHWTRDRVAPPVPSVVAPASPGDSRSPSFAVSDTEPAVSYTCSTSPAVPVTTCGPTTTLDLSAAANGSYAVTVEAVDAAGNSSAGKSASYTLDTTAPPSPVVTAPASPGHGRSPSFTVTDTEAGVTFTCTVSPTVPVSGCGATTGLSLSGAADGPYTLSVTATDVAGNVSAPGSATYTLDTATPPTPVVVGPASPGHSRTPSFTVTDAQPDLTYTCTVSPVVPIAACGATPSLDLSGAADRSYTLSVVGTDAAGNPSLAGKAAYALDSVAPPAPAVTVSGSPGSSLFPAFTVSDSEAGVTYSCTATPAVPVTACGPSSGLDLTGGQPDGSYSLSVTATDPAGNISAARSATYVLDTTAPPSPLVTPASSSGQSRTPPGFAVSDTEPGTTYLCSLAPAGTVRVCGASTTVSLTGVPDGAYTLSVSALDAAGNVSAPTQAVYTLDTTAPPAPVLVAPASPGMSRFPVFATSDTEAGVTFACSVAPAGSVRMCGASTKLSLTGAADGSYTVSVTATDSDGNVSPAGTATYRLDTTAPTAPSVTPLVAAGSTLSPAFTVTAAETGLSYTCTTSPAVTVTTCGASSSLDLTGDVDGSYRLSVTTTDAAGNVSAAGSGSYRLDTTPPPVPSVTAPSSPGNSLTPSFTVSDTEPGIVFSCSVTPTVTVSRCGTSTRLSLTGALDGPYTVSVTATDAVGNTSNAGTATYVLDTTAPLAPLVIGPLLPSSNPKPVFVIVEPGILDPSVTLSCVLTSPGGATVSSGACPANGRFDTAGNGDGRYVLVVTATDAAGNTATATAFYVLDTTAPPAPVVTVAATGNGTAPAFAFSDREAGATLSCVLTASDGHVLDSASPCTSPYVADLSGLGDDSYTLSVTATDVAANTSTGSATYRLDTQPPPAPTVTAPASPAQGRSPLFTVSESEPGTSLSCAVTPLVPIGGSCGSPTLNLTNGSDGPYTLTVTATDAAGNSSVQSATYVLDTTAPAVPGIAVTRSPSNSTSPLFTVTDSEPGATVHCTLLDPDGNVVTSHCPSAPVDLSGGPDGTYQLQAFATDAAGNVSATATATYFLDTVPPPAPTVIQSTPLSSRPTAFWQWRHDPTELDPSDDTADCVLSGPAGFADDLGSCPSPAAFTTTLTAGEGRYTLTVTLTDEAGNTSRGSATYDFDKSAGLAPVVYLQSPAGGIGQSRHPVWFVEGGNHAVLHCQLVRGDQHGTPVSAATRCSMPATYDLTGMADGSYTLVVSAQEVDGTTVKPEWATYLLDTTAPHAPRLLSGTSSPSAVTTPQWSFELPPDAVAGRCEWLRNGTRLATQTRCDGTTTLSLAGLSDGPVTIKIFAFDIAGNRSRPLVINYVLDRFAPARPDVSPPSGSGSTAVWTVHGNPSDTFTCTLSSNGSVVESAQICGSHPTYEMGSRPSGTYTLSVTQTDAAGARSQPGTASWLWLNPDGSAGLPHHGGTGTGAGPGKHGARGPHQPGLVSTLPTIVQHALHKLGKAISHPGTTPRRLVRVVVPVPDEVSHAVQSAISAVGQAGGGTGFPLILIGLVVVFLAVQNRIDRRDPKLAFVSVAADDLVEFLPPPSREDGA